MSTLVGPVRTSRYSFCPMLHSLIQFRVEMCSDGELWEQIASRLQQFPGRLRVARIFVELGLSVKEDGSISCGPVEMSDVKIARAVGVDRRTVRETAKFILGDEKLKAVFASLRPAGPSLVDAAKFLGYAVIEIEADPRTVGILAQVASLISHESISVRQAVADDPDLNPEPKLRIVTEREVSGAALQKMLRILGVKKVSTY